MHMVLVYHIEVIDFCIHITIKSNNHHLYVY